MTAAVVLLVVGRWRQYDMSDKGQGNYIQSTGVMADSLFRCCFVCFAAFRRCLLPLDTISGVNTQSASIQNIHGPSMGIQTHATRFQSGRPLHGGMYRGQGSVIIADRFGLSCVNGSTGVNTFSKLHTPYTPCPVLTKPNPPLSMATVHPRCA